MNLRKTVFLIALDCVFGWLSWLGSIFAFVYMLDYYYVYRSTLVLITTQHIPVVIVACILFFSICGVYKSLWQHLDIGSIIRISVAILMTSFTVYISFRLRLGFWLDPGIGILSFYFMFSLSLSVRIYKRVWVKILVYLRRYMKLPSYLVANENLEVRTLLIGAGDSASAFLLTSSQHGSRPRNILGILDNDPRKHGYNLHGVDILGDDNKIPILVKNMNIDEIVIAIPSIDNEELRRIVKLTPISRCKVRLISGLGADKTVEKLRDININDLLGRQEVKLNEIYINKWLGDKTVLITGGGGSIGSEICRQLLCINVTHIVIFDISENNVHNLREELKIKYGQSVQHKLIVRIGSVQDESRLNEVFTEFKPSVVFHAAAFKHVPLMEECPRLAIENNVLGTYLTALTAFHHKAERFVLISTDKAVNPTNVMGASKRLAEILVLGLNQSTVTEFLCVRFGNVLDSNGSVIPIFKRQIEAGGPITITHPNIIRYFMTIPEAARLVLEAGAMGKGGEIFILDMGDPVKIIDLAENLIRMAGLTPDVDIKIKFIGLRPGEKLYEELLLNEEGLTKTLHDKIFVINSKPTHSPENVINRIKYNQSDIRSLLKELIPEYNYTENIL